MAGAITATVVWMRRCTLLAYNSTQTCHVVATASAAYIIQFLYQMPTQRSQSQCYFCTQRPSATAELYHVS